MLTHNFVKRIYFVYPRRNYADNWSAKWAKTRNKAKNTHYWIDYEYEYLTVDKRFKILRADLG